MTEAEVAVRAQWMDDNLLKTCITRSLNIPSTTDIDIVDVAVTYAVPKGENYMSVIYRAVVTYHILSGSKSNGVQNGGGSSSVSLIMKVSHESKELKILAKEANIFPKETDMYTNIIPTLTKVLESAEIPANIACRCLHSVEGDRDMLIMEDLKPKGYLLADRLRGLDLPHCKVVFDKLAKLHASSMHYYKTHDIPEMYNKTPFDINKESFGEMAKIFEKSMHEKVDKVLAELKKYPHHAKHIEFFKRFGKLPMEGVHNIWKSVPGNKFNAILHGDSWVNNMMFKYNEDGSVQDVLLVDLQICYWSSVCNDFTYFFFSSSDREVRRNHFNYLKKLYIDRLIAYLQQLGYTGKIPTMAEFDTELKRLGILAVYMITHFSSIILNEFNAEQKSRDKSEAFDMKEMMEIMKTPSRNFYDRLLASIDTLEESGYFENMMNLPEVTED